MRPFAAAAFCTAALLFLVQPIAGRTLLPVYGGSASVWTACLLFFQAGLLAAYALAHWLGKWSGRAQAVTYFTGIIAGWVLLARTSPIEASSGDPTWEVLVSVLTRYGAGYVAVGMSSPILQTWLSSVLRGASPYWLYAYSNAGALTALLSYPILLEPTMSLQVQHRMLWLLFAASLVLVVICWRQCNRTRRHGRHYGGQSTHEETAKSASWQRRAVWFFLAFGGSATLLGVTNEMCREIAVVPFLWILPLTVYLFTFIYSFRKGFCATIHQLCLSLAVGVLLGTAVLAAGNALVVWFQVVLLSFVLLAVCFACHGLLAITRPSPKGLTDFYLTIAAGGAGGGCFVALAAPRLFSDYDELPWVVAAVCVVAGFQLAGQGGWRDHPATRGILAGLLLAAGGALTLVLSTVEPGTVEKRRNFYGTLQVIENTNTAGKKLTLHHGRVLHGLQYRDPEKGSWPTAYYGPSSGAGIELQSLPANSTVALLGLGVGTLAAYARQGDLYVFYEIDEDVVDIASKYFTYLRHCKGEIAIRLGDARLLMQRETSTGMRGRFEAIIVDVFTSGAIPVHMLTLEAAYLYRENLKSNGKILYHISNQALDLDPVVRGLANKLGMACTRVDSMGQPTRGTNGATWMILSGENGQGSKDSGRRRLLWTDNHSSLWQVLKWTR